MNETRQVKLGNKLFSKEKKMYRNWAEAWIREATQNSVDAGASRININIEDDGNIKKVTFSDNGPGMDMNVIENVFMTLGETTKTSPTTIGGYGIARLLICFAMEKYQIRTQDVLIDGCGAEWTPQTGLDYRKGVEFTVWINPDSHDLADTFKRFLSTCHISAQVFINGERWNEWTYKNKHERDLTFGSVYTNKSKSTGVLVRSNGVTMFRAFLSAPFQIVIELDPTRSRDILQANRDGLTWQYQSELESFISELNINKQSALREKRSKSTTYQGSGTFTAKRSKKAEVAQIVESLEQSLINGGYLLDEKVKQTLLKGSLERVQEAAHAALVAHGITPPPAPVAAQHSSGFDIDEERQTLNNDLFSVVVHDDTRNPRVRKVIDSYNPANFDLYGEIGSRYDRRYGERRSFRAGVEKYKLLVLWKAACEFCIRMLQDNLQRGPEEISWGVGWIFSDHAAAENKRTDGVNWLLINPVDHDGKMKLSISDKRDLVKILSCAAHEVVHLIASSHDEVFANLLNDLLEECMANLGEALKFMKDAKSAAEDRLNRISDHNREPAYA